MKIQVHIREKKTLCSVLKKPAVIEVSFTLQVAQQLLTAAITEVHGTKEFDCFMCDLLSSARTRALARSQDMRRLREGVQLF